MSYLDENGLSRLTYNIKTYLKRELEGVINYPVTTNIINGTATGDSTANYFTTSTINITPNINHILPTSIIVTGADYTYDNTTGVVTIRHAEGPVTIEAICIEILEVEYNYTGYTQSILLSPGNYSLECWGADGGAGMSSGSQPGGKGGYSKGNLTLSSATTLYLIVGGKGESSTGATSDTLLGGYNGGGNGGHGTYASASGNPTGSSGGGGGGGATHIATRDGLLETLSSYISDIKIVAGGGGGGCWKSDDTAPNGGGVSGASAHDSNTYCGGAGTQSSGGVAGSGSGTTVTTSATAGTFGRGGNGSITSSGTSVNAAGGGGSGYYGGGGAKNSPSGTNADGGGGSGYIGGVINGVTYKATDTGYISNPDTSGNGHIKITRIE